MNTIHKLATQNYCHKVNAITFSSFHLAYADRAALLASHTTEPTTLTANQHTASISQSAAAYQEERRDSLGKCLWKLFFILLGTI